MPPTKRGLRNHNNRMTDVMMGLLEEHDRLIEVLKEQEAVINTQSRKIGELIDRQADMMSAMAEFNFRLTFLLMRSKFTIHTPGSIMSLTPRKDEILSGWELLSREREHIEREMAALVTQEAEKMRQQAQEAEAADAESTPDPEGRASGTTPAGDPPVNSDAPADDAAAPRRRSGALPFARAAGDAEETRH